MYYKNKTTRCLWDGNKVLHEWSEGPQELDILKTPQNIVTWLYKEGTFIPIGKLTENDNYSIVSDHLGTPTEMYNSKGTLVWKIVKDIFGRVRHKIGGETKETDCPIRSQGQYEDYETEMYYNRFRYYMPDEGMYSQRDSIGLAGGNPTLYGYVWDSTMQVDVLGLSNCPTDGVTQVDDFLRTGTSKPDKISTPNTIYEQLNPDGSVKSRAFYDENGRQFNRQDFDHEHFSKEYQQYFNPHEHSYIYTEHPQGISVKEFDGPLPEGYNNTATILNN